MLIDGEKLLTGSENLNYSSMPADDKSDGTLGNRGVWLITDAPSAVTYALDVLQHDLDPVHNDIVRWSADHPIYGAPPPTYTVVYSSGGTFYPVQFPTPLTVQGTFAFEMVQSPDNSLRVSDSLLGMVARAGPGDTVLVEQLYERTYWGPVESNPVDDPNLRLEAYIDAARRGAKVLILLDSVFDDAGDPRGNTATCTYVNDIATSEGLDLGCQIANPTGAGINNNMVLVQAGGHGYVHTGSINGSDNSSKNNREFAVQVQSDAAYHFLADVFWSDYGESVEEPSYAFLPVVMRNYPPLPNQPTLYPISNADGDGTYTVGWTEAPQRWSDTYALEEATDAAFTSDLRLVCTTVQQSCSVTGKVAGIYYYRGRGQNTTGYGPYSNTETVAVLAPGTPTLSPIDNGDGDGNYTVAWSAAAQTTSYTLQEDTDSNFGSPTTVYEGSSLSWLATNQPGGTYYYRVRAQGPTGQSAWSNTQSVTVFPSLVADLYIQALVYDQSDERIQITNRGTAAQDMTSWQIQSMVENQWYTFPNGYTLGPGASVYVHSGPDAYQSPPAHLLWGYSHIWNDDGDVALLCNGDDDVVDSYAYGTPPPHTIEYLKYDGQQTTEQWFRAEFGEFIIEELPTTEYRVAVMAAATGYATFRIRVLDENQDPVADYPVDWYWSGGHIPAQTNAEGWADFAMGTGAYYQPDLGQIGPHWVTVSGTTIRGIGMILFTPHDHFDVVVWAGQPTSPDEYTLTLNVDGSGTVQVAPLGHRTQMVPR